MVKSGADRDRVSATGGAQQLVTSRVLISRMRSILLYGADLTGLKA